MHLYTDTYTHAYIYIYTCLYMYIHTHIYTHTYNMYICTHASTLGTTAWQRLREKPNLKPGSSTLFPVCAAHHTITTARRPDYTRSTGAEPIYLIHGCFGCGPRRSCSGTGFTFLPFSRRFLLSISNPSLIHR